MPLGASGATPERSGGGEKARPAVTGWAPNLWRGWGGGTCARGRGGRAWSDHPGFLGDVSANLRTARSARNVVKPRCILSASDLLPTY